METFPPNIIEGIAVALGEVGSGSDMSRAISHYRWTDDSNQSTKWRRFDYLFNKQQALDKSPNAILGFIKFYFAPSKFVNDNPRFESLREQLNLQLAFVGLEYSPAGEFLKVSQVKTISEAENRLRTLKARLQGRVIHHFVLDYCRIELLQDDFFHAVFEASKGLAQRIRDMTGIQKDGAALVDECFGLDHPVIAFNTLQTESEQSEHKGFAMLLKGCFAAIRNPLAHEPRILWTGEEDALDYFTLLSMLHRKLDSAIVIKRNNA